MRQATSRSRAEGADLGSGPPHARKLRVLLADNHAPTRSDVTFLLERDGRFCICAEAADAATAIRCARELRPDVVVLDVGLTGSGHAALWEISAGVPDTRIIVLTESRDEKDLFGALRAGAHAYLLKDMNPYRLPEAVYDVYRGSVAFPRSLVALMVEEFREATPRRRQLTADGVGARLTSREWQVLEMLSHDLSTADIAARLVLTAGAVRAHIAAIVRKLGVRNRDEAIARFTSRSDAAEPQPLVPHA
jgi:DNA-binding NarL/FixJ family response regulator